jgi:polar amino acid transport system permease protein
LSTQTYRPIETFTVVALIYLAISFPVSQLVTYFERRNSRQMDG